ncbi:hypothetical protein M438DRAFT_110922 [Aureobasidium pullulans EXF-150]|uniref:Uncharacterized protein n=1 Tax=Aureobasidium pullulans EXF-150 TaxID=1043002 RepID=A0A074X4P7_AURPU|nr:uncharacterized protein M438DRAFT_110922 [Aureobasidium pullulans EXF-150]KEQ80363.1 hypothetical protein M438DRAFT_110922 [Aureobasidium pullulans EXF-150]
MHCRYPGRQSRELNPRSTITNMPHVMRKWLYPRLCKSTAASQETKKEAAEAQRLERSGSHKRLQLDTNATRSCTATPPRSSARRSTILHIYQIFVWLMAIFTPRFSRPAYSRSYFQMSKPD